MAEFAVAGDGRPGALPPHRPVRVPAWRRYHRVMRLAFALLALLIVTGCKKAGGGGGDGGPALVSIAVSPADALVSLGVSTAGAQTFVATGTWDDESTADVTGDVTWSLANGAIGSFTGATLQIAALTEVATTGSTITASLDGVDGAAYLTVVALGTADLLFTLPYLDTAGPSTQNAKLVARRPSASDVFLLVDATGSMGGEIANLKSALTATIAPGIRAEIPDSNFGVAAFMDFPVAPYGSTNASADCTGAEAAADQPLKVRQVLTSSLSVAQAAVNGLSGTAPIGCGGDFPEALIEGLYQTATGGGLNAPSPTSVPAVDPGFREGASHVIVAVSDIASHAPGETTSCNGTSVDYGGAVAMAAHTRTAAKSALGAACLQVIGIASDSGNTCSAAPDLSDFATATGARVPPSAWDTGTRPAGCAANQCCTGISGVGLATDGDGLCPLVFRADSNGAGLGSQIVTGFVSLGRFAGREITALVSGENASVDGAALPAGTTADFVSGATPVSFAEPLEPPALPDPTFDAMGFHGVAADTELTWSVAAFNDVIASAAAPRLFRARLQLIADGCHVADERNLLFLVPRGP